MNERTHEIINTGKGLIKAWVKGVPFEEQAQKQLENIASLPFIHKWVAAMPDVHHGIGATVGSVIATKKAVIPAAVGVDIGCGMMAARTTLKASDLPHSLAPLRSAIEAAIPHGRTDNGRANDRGAWSDPPDGALARWKGLDADYRQIVDKHPKIARGVPANGDDATHGRR